MKTILHKGILFFSILIFSFTSVFAQQEMRYTQSQFFPSNYNPSYTKNDSTIIATFAFRDQWPNLNGHPIGGIVLYEQGIKKFNLGTGVHIAYDQTGSTKDYQVGIPISYSIKINNTSIRFGIMPGLKARTTDFNYFIAPSSTPDPLVPSGKMTDQKFDMSGGLAIIIRSFEIGLGATHLTQPEFHYKALSSTIERHYYANANYLMNVTSRYSFLASFIFCETGTTTTYDINLTNYFGKYFLGFTARDLGRNNINPFAVNAGIMIRNKFYIGLSYDIPGNEVISEPAFEALIKIKLR